MAIRGRIISASRGRAQSEAQHLDALGIKIAGAGAASPAPTCSGAPYQGAEVFEAAIFSPKRAQAIDFTRGNLQTTKQIMTSSKDRGIVSCLPASVF